VDIVEEDSRRWTRVVEAFPDSEAALMLTGARLRSAGQLSLPCQLSRVTKPIDGFLIK
jgi:hypothetical protein